MNDDKIAIFFEGIANDQIEAGKFFSFLAFCNCLQSKGFFRLLGMSLKPRTQPKLLETVIPFFLQYAKNHGYVILCTNVNEIKMTTDNTGGVRARDISTLKFQDITDTWVFFKESEVSLTSFNRIIES